MTFSDIRGARATGTVPVREDLINSMIAEEIDGRSGPVQEVEIRVGGGNHLQVGLRVAIGPFSKWFRPELVLSPQAVLAHSPCLHFTIATAHYGAIVRLFSLFAKDSLPPGVHLSNQQVSIDFALLPQTAKYRPYFQHLRDLQLTTRPGVLTVAFDLEVQ
jgi:hypothetical protein